MIYNKRGQFFIIAAIIIIGIVMGSFAVINSIRTSEENKAFYDLTDEIGFESRKVLDYGFYNTTNVSNVTMDFLKTYADYIANEGVLFIYGDRSKTDGWFFHGVPGNIGINTGTIPGTITIQQITGQQAQVNYDSVLHDVNVTIEDLTYTFRLREGENFYFVIIKEENDEKFVAQG